MEKNDLLAGIIIGVLVVVVLIAGYNAFFSLTGKAVAGQGSMPEKCQMPAGTTPEKWKEHLGHHAETQECLKYY